MVLRRPRTELFYLLFSLCAHFSIISADDPFSCHVSVDSLKFDLTSLNGEHTVSRNRDSPPTKWTDTVRMNLCGVLEKQNMEDRDQCPDGTQVCLTKTNRRDDQDRVVAVIPIVQTSKLHPEYTVISSPSKGLSLVLHGDSYPHPSDSTPTAQYLNLTLLCNPDHTDDNPEFVSYDGTELRMKWDAKAGCSFQEGDHSNDGKEKEGEGKEGEGDAGEKESVGSGIGWFFLMLLLAFVAYFGLGAYYNYSTYGASGVDLIPHRDFWKEVPYMLSDVVSHLCSSVRSRRTISRGGYISV